MYLLDTNACIRILNNSSPKLVERFQQHDPTEICLCSIVKSELLYGARRSAQVTENLQLLQWFFQPLISLPFDDHCAEHYGFIRAEQERTGQLIGGNDMLIAATAKAHNCVLVTHNVRELTRVVGLKIEDWEI